MKTSLYAQGAGGSGAGSRGQRRTRQLLRAANRTLGARATNRQGGTRRLRFR